MEIGNVNPERQISSAEDQIGNGSLGEGTPTVSRAAVDIWAETQRSLHATGDLPMSHFEALNAIPGWTWELTKNKG